MSLVGLNYVEVKDPVIDVSYPREIGVLNGGKEVSYRVFPAASPSQNMNITLDPPDENSIIGPQIDLECQFTVNFTGTNTSGASSTLLNLNGGDGPRSEPIHNTLINSSVSFGGQAFQTTQQEYFNALQRTGITNELLYKNFSTGLAFPDLSQQYVDLTGAARNPLNSYVTSSPFTSTRGSINYDSITNTSQAPGAMTASVTFTSFERFIISPLYNSKAGITNVRTLNLTIQFGNLQRIWSHFDSLTGVTMTGLSASVANFRVHASYITSKIPRAPKDETVPYHEFLILNSQTYANIAPGTNFTGTVNSVNIGSIPGIIMIYAREQNSDLFNSANCFLKTDSFASVYQGNFAGSSSTPGYQPLTVQFSNRQGLMSASTAQDLYQISLKNGLNMSWPEFSQYCGSVILLNPATNFGLAPDEAISVQKNPQLSISCTFRNPGNGSGPNGGSKNYVMYAIVIYSGAATFHADGNVSKKISTLTPRDAENSLHTGRYLVDRPNNSMMGGGDLFGNFKHFLSSANDFLKNNKVISSVAKEINDPYGIGKAVGVVADKFGYGRRSKRAGSVVLEQPEYFEDMELGGGRKMKLSHLRKRRGGSANDNNDYSSDDE